MIKPSKDIDIFSINLTPEEGLVLSRIERKLSFKELKVLTGLVESKLIPILESLFSKGVIKVEGLKDKDVADTSSQPVVNEGFTLSFSEGGIVEIFIKIKKEKLDGFLKVKKDSEWKMIFFRKGNPVYAVSNISSELLGSLLVAIGVIDREILKELLRESEKIHARLGDIVVEKGIISREVLQRVLRKQVEIKVVNLFKWKKGEAEFVPRKSFDIPFMHELSTGSILYKVLKENLSNDEITDFIENRINMYIYPASQPSFNWGEINLDQREKILVDVVKERPRLVREVISLSPLMLLSTYRVIVVLAKLGMIEFREKMIKEENIQNLKIELKEKLERLHGDNFFGRLVLHESAIEEEVEAAYRDAKALYNPAKYPDDEEIMAFLSNINRLIDEAYQVLKERSSREKYRKEIFQRNKLIFEASIQYEKGELELLREDFKEAYYLFRSAEELYPEKIEYKSAAFLTGYFYYRGMDGQKAEEYQKKFLDILDSNLHNEKILFHGYLYEKLKGNTGGARNYLQRIIEINPENADARKALNSLN